MKIVISSGHGKHIRGASGSPVPPQCDEVNEARKVVEQVATVLRGMGVNVTTFHDDVSDDQSENLNRIVNFHNAQGSHDWDVSVHFNASDEHTGHGVEVLWVSSAGETMATKMSKAISDASGLTNRGAKFRDGLAFLNGTNEPAVLVETAFCDNTADCNTYRNKFTDICAAIAGSLAGAEVDVPRPPVIPERPGSADDAIMDIAMNSAIAKYEWKDRGKAPAGYIKGFALAWAQVVKRFEENDPQVSEMAKANKHNDDKDALSWMNSDFAKIGMTNEYSDIHTLRHLFVLLLGLGMRESSGRHCVGADTSAPDYATRPSDEVEAGLYQTSYNAHSCNPAFDVIMEDYVEGRLEDYAEVFKEGVSCSTSDWKNWGSGSGQEFQQLCKEAPAFAVESCAIVLRNLRQHYGPINRKEVELKRESDDMLLEVQRYVENEGEV